MMRSPVRLWKSCLAGRSLDRVVGHAAGREVGRPAKLGALACLMILGLLGGCSQAPKAEKKDFVFWPPAPDVPRLQFVTSFSSARDVTGAAGKLDEMLYGKESQGDLPFKRPFGVRMHNGRIYVCDASANNITVLDLRKKELRVLGTGTGLQLLKPIDLAVSPDGFLYVADTGHKGIIVFGPDEKFVTKIARPDSDMRPVAAVVWKDELFVSDMYASQVVVFNRKTGKMLRTIGQRGPGEGQLTGAMGLALDPEGNVYISDVVACRIQKFSHEGKYLMTFGGAGDRPGNLARPKHMAMDSQGLLYVVDAAYQNVQIFNEKGQVLMYFGSSGPHPGAMDMPAGICVDDADLELFAPQIHPAFQAQRLVVVTNNLGPTKINVYALGTLKPGKTLADLNRGRATVESGFNDKPQEADVASSQPADGASETPATSQPAGTQPSGVAASQPAAKPAGPKISPIGPIGPIGPGLPSEGPPAPGQ